MHRKNQLDEKKLLVILNYRLSSIITKGELIARYFNPGNLFGEVHILLTKRDEPNLRLLKKTVGNAKLYVHVIPPPKTLQTLGFRPFLMKHWAKKGVQIAREIKPNLMRVHGDNFNGFLAYCIKSDLGIPYVMSYHTNPDERVINKDLTLPNAFALWLLRDGKKLAIRNADCILPVYKSIIPYLNRMGAKCVRVAYNVINPVNVTVKTNYRLHNPIRLIYVGRLLQRKNPINIIRALEFIPNTTLHIVGDGPIRSDLEKLSTSLRVRDRIIFTPAIPNDKLCKLLPQQDLFIVHMDDRGISKTILEALLSALPVVINRQGGKQKGELVGDFIKHADNNPKSYAETISQLIEDNAMRRRLGQSGRLHAMKLWDPKKTEARYVEIYKQLMI